MRNLLLFLLFILIIVPSCGDEIIETVYVPVTDTIYVSQTDTIIVFDNSCDHPFAIGDVFDLEDGPYYFEADSSSIELVPFEDLMAIGWNPDFSLYHRVYGSEQESFEITLAVSVVCGYIPSKEELVYLWVGGQGDVYLWAIQTGEGEFEVSIIADSENLNRELSFHPIMYKMTRRN